MASKTDTTIFYQNQIEICKRHFTAEQFGRLMLALFEVEEGQDPEVDEDIAIAFEFMALQKKIDREKYEKKCQKNRENGKKGGRPPKPKKANGYSENPNDDNDDEDDDKNDDDNDKIQHLSSFGLFDNVELTDAERTSLKDMYENSGKLIDKVSVWLRDAKYEVPDHFALCLKFANNESWPKRKVIEPVSLPEVNDPLSEEEQRERMAEMHRKLNGAFTSS